MNNTRISTFDDVFSVIAWSIVYPWGNGNTFSLLHFMMGGRLIRKDIPKAIIFCRKQLLIQFPELATRDMVILLASIEDDISKIRGKEEKKVAISLCLNDLRQQYNRPFLVKPFDLEDIPTMD